MFDVATVSAAPHSAKLGNTESDGRVAGCVDFRQDTHGLLHPPLRHRAACCLVHCRELRCGFVSVRRISPEMKRKNPPTLLLSFSKIFLAGSFFFLNEAAALTRSCNQVPPRAPCLRSAPPAKTKAISLCLSRHENGTSIAKSLGNRHPPLCHTARRGGLREGAHLFRIHVSSRNVSIQIEREAHSKLRSLSRPRALPLPLPPALCLMHPTKHGGGGVCMHRYPTASNSLLSLVFEADLVSAKVHRHRLPATRQVQGHALSPVAPVTTAHAPYFFRFLPGRRKVVNSAPSKHSADRTRTRPPIRASPFTTEGSTPSAISLKQGTLMVPAHSIISFRHAISTRPPKAETNKMPALGVS